MMQAIAHPRSSNSSSSSCSELKKTRVLQGTSSPAAIHPDPPRRVTCLAKEPTLYVTLHQQVDSLSKNDSSSSDKRAKQEVAGSVGSLSTSHPSASQHSDESIGKRLKYEQVGVVGREEEMKVIQESLDKVYKKKQRELLFLRGPSGSGKTCLANLATASYDKHAVVASGKFDLFLRDEPYAGIIDALDGLTMNILIQQQTSQEQAVGSELSQAQARSPVVDARMLISELGSTEADLLANLIPSLDQFLHAPETNTEASQKNAAALLTKTSYTGSSSLALESKSNQLHYVFRKFIRFLSRHAFPLVILLDDLQWADIQSLELLHLLMTDRENRDGLMIFGLYRSNDNTTLSTEDPQTKKETHEKDITSNDAIVLKKTIEALRDTRDQHQDDSFHMRELSLDNLSLDQVNQMIMRLLSIDDANRTKDLADICHRRTLGNAQFVVTFMTMLFEERLLTFQLGTRRWTWDEAEMQKETGVADNVVKMLTKKISKASGDVVQFLQIASCLGSEFDAYILQSVWIGISSHHMVDDESRLRHAYDINESFRTSGQQEEGDQAVSLMLGNGLNDDNEARTTFNRLLQEAVRADYFEEVGPTRFRWVHDNIQEAAMSLLAPEEVSSFKFAVGVVLMRTLDEPNLNKNIFVVANLVNNTYDGMVICSARKIQLSMLNLMAAKKAKECSAFASAARYAGIGIRHLPPDKWTNHFQLSLELYSIGTEVCGTRGEISTMDLYANEITRQPSCTMYDKLRAYKTILESRESEGRSQEALELCLMVLKELGCGFPSGLRRIGRVISTMSKLKKVVPPTKEEISKLPMMTDPTRIECMRFMRMLGTLCMMTDGNELLFLLALTRQTSWTLRYGLDVTSPSAFVGFGMVVMGVLNDYEMASHYANHAICMLDRLPDVAISPTLYSAHYLVLSWKNPIHSCLQPLRVGFEAGMRVGDSDSACFCLLTEVGTLLCSGKSLRAVLNVTCQLYVPQMEELKRTETADLARLNWQVAQNLMGFVGDPKSLTGDAADEQMMLTKYLGKKKSTIPITISVLKSYMYVYLGEYELGADLAIQRGDSYLKIAPGSLIGMWDVFARGVCLYAEARKTGKRKFKKAADCARKKIRSWSEKGNPNVNHHLLLLNAEHAALRGIVEQAHSMYQKAISAAVSGGFVQDAALANERYADFLAMIDMEESGSRVQEAVRLYTMWGAHGKVSTMRRSHPDLFDMTLQSSTYNVASRSSSLTSMAPTL